MEKQITEKNKKNSVCALETIVYILTVISMFLGVLDLADVLKLYPFDGIFTFIGVAGILLCGCFILYSKYKKNVFRFLGVVIAIAAVAELTVFQYPSYSSFASKAKPSSIRPSEAIISGSGCEVNNDGSVTISGNGEISLFFDDFNKEINTVKADVKFHGKTKYTSFSVDASDETSIAIRTGMASGGIVKGRERTEHLRMNLSGKVPKFYLKFANSVPESEQNKEDYKITIRNIEFNKAIPFEFLYFRFILIVLIALLVYALVSSKTLRSAFDTGGTRFMIAAGCVLLAAIIVVVGLIGAKLPSGGLKEDFNYPAENQINKELVDAFEDGKVSLNLKPSENFKSIKNPYDYYSRSEAGETGEWDHVYYNEKYYSYYGVAPVLVLFMPYHQITGRYFPTDIAVGLFSILGLIFLSMFYYEFIRRYFGSLPMNIVLSGYVIMIASCGAFYLAGRTLFYEISVSSGFMFTTLGALLLLRSNALDDGNKVNSISALFSSLCFGLAVLSRPTLAVYAFCAALFFLRRIVVDFKAKNKDAFLFTICAVLPLFACAVFQMWYNFARFGSVFDFGIKYSITINDFTHNSFYLIFVLIVIFNYILNPPVLSASYPFVTTNFDSLGAKGYFFHDIGTVSGILFLALPTFGYVFSGKALKKLPDKKTKRKMAWMLGLPCVLMPLVIICASWESGYAIRYVADFSWEMLLGALVILFFLYQKSENEYKKQLFAKLMAFCAVAAIVINGIQIFNFAFAQNEFPQNAAYLKSLISFWV